MVSKFSIDYLVIFGVTISGLLAILIIGVPIIAPFIVKSYAIPKTIENWGGVIIGFYFGSFFMTVIDVIKSQIVTDGKEKGE